MTTEPREAGIVVRACSVRVVRRGGWSWGPHPGRLAQRVVDALPALLAERFAGLLAAGEDVELTEPVRLDVSASLADLLAGRPPRMDLGAGQPDPPTVLSTVVGHGALDTPVPGGPPTRSAASDLPTGANGTGRREPFRPTGPDDADGSADGERAGGAPDRPRAATGPPDDGAGPWRAPAGIPAGVGRLVAGEVEVHSVLPFLLASALHRIGLLDGIGPALEDDAPLFAAALAYKVLGPPRRGWLRSADDRAAAASFAGLDGEIPDDALTALAHRAGPALPRLDAQVALSVCAGHEPGRPLLLVAPDGRHGGGLLLAEPDGLFPIAWTDGATALLPSWEACGRPPVLLGADSGALAPVGVRHTRALADAGVPLASGAAPSRGERWRRLPPGEAARLDLTGLSARLGDLVTAMAERRAVPLAADPTFERTLTTTAAVALGTIAWLLWRHREPPDPQLALTRLGDLSGLVRFATDTVHVRIPLGRRHADLREHGLLADVPRVAWLGGRTLTFGGG